MTIELITYTGMVNENRIKLLQSGILVVALAITKATFKFGDYCVNTDDDPDIINFLADSDNQILCFHLGLIPDIVSGRYTTGMLSLVEADNTIHSAWALISVWVKPWSICDIL